MQCIYPQPGSTYTPTYTPAKIYTYTQISDNRGGGVTFPTDQGVAHLVTYRILAGAGKLFTFFPLQSTVSVQRFFKKDVRTEISGMAIFDDL